MSSRIPMRLNVAKKRNNAQEINLAERFKKDLKALAKKLHFPYDNSPIFPDINTESREEINKFMHHYLDIIGNVGNFLEEALCVSLRKYPASFKLFIYYAVERAAVTYIVNEISCIEEVDALSELVGKLPKGEELDLMLS